jgi:hypothetical protein
LEPITNPPSRPSLTSLRTLRVGRLVPIVLLGAAIWYLGRLGLWPLAALVVAGFELVPQLAGGREPEARVPAIIVGASTALIIALLPKAISQVVVAILYIGWRVWQDRAHSQLTPVLANLLIVEAVGFEAIFLAAAVRHWATPIILALVWLVAYVPVYLVLNSRRERAAAVLAAAWAMVAAELAWVFMTWLVSYIAQASYVIIPQPALILTTLAYCFGSIYFAQRQNKLNRARLTEYLLIAVILLAVVIAGTPWRGSV